MIPGVAEVKEMTITTVDSANKSLQWYKKILLPLENIKMAFCSGKKKELYHCDEVNGVFEW